MPEPLPPRPPAAAPSRRPAADQGEHRARGVPADVSVGWSGAVQLAFGLAAAALVSVQRGAAQAVLFHQPRSPSDVAVGRELFGTAAWIAVGAFVAAGATMAVASWLASRRGRARRAGPSFARVLAVGWLSSLFVVGQALSMADGNVDVAAHPTAFGWWWFVAGAVVVPALAVVTFVVRFRSEDDQPMADVALPGVFRPDPPA